MPLRDGESFFKGIISLRKYVVEPARFELATSRTPSVRATNCATARFNLKIQSQSD